MQDSNPLDRAIHENYSALARKHGVKLHFKRRPYKPRPAAEPCCRTTLNGQQVPEGWCEEMSVLRQFDGTIERSPFPD